MMTLASSTQGSIPLYHGLPTLSQRLGLTTLPNTTMMSRKTALWCMTLQLRTAIRTTTHSFTCLSPPARNNYDPPRVGYSYYVRELRWWRGKKCAVAESSRLRDSSTNNRHYTNQDHIARLLVLLTVDEPKVTLMTMTMPKPVTSTRAFLLFEQGQDIENKKNNHGNIHNTDTDMDVEMDMDIFENEYDGGDDTENKNNNTGLRNYR